MSASTNKHKIWTPDDDEKLLKMYGTSCLDYISKTLKRDQKDCHRRHRKLVGSAAIEVGNGYFTTSQLAECVGVTRRTVHGWIVNHSLPFIQLTKGKRLINPEVFWKWAAMKKKYINFLKYKEGTICPEPNWVSQEIKNAKACLIAYKKNKKWTTPEENMLLFLVDGGHGNKEIALRLDRTVGSVKLKKYILLKDRQSNQNVCKNII